MNDYEELQAATDALKAWMSDKPVVDFTRLNYMIRKQK